MNTLKTPLTSQDIPDSWIDAFRDAASHGASYRPSPTQASIEVKSETRGWMPVMLSSGSKLFAAVEDRDEVMRRLA